MYYFFYSLPVLLFLALRGRKNETVSKKRFIIIMTLVLSICSALRNEYVGNDTPLYKRSYEEIRGRSFYSVIEESADMLHSAGDIEGRDPGYLIVTKICSSIMSFRVFLFLVSLLLTSSIGYLILKNVKHLSGFIIAYAFYVSLFYHYLPNSAIRQTIAMGLIIWGQILWFDKNKRVVPILLFLLGLLIHKSGFLGILPLVLMYSRKKNALRYVALVGFFIFVVAGQSFSVLFAKLLNSETYMGYATSSAYDEIARPIFFVIQMFLIYIISWFPKIDIDNQSRIEQLASVCFYLGVMTAPIIFVSPSQIRGNAFFTIWGVAFIPNLVYYSYPKWRTAIYALLLVLTLGRPIAQGVPEFKFYWEPMVFQGIHE